MNGFSSLKIHFLIDIFKIEKLIMLLNGKIKSDKEPEIRENKK